MTQFAKRLAELSPERRQLLDQLLTQRESQTAGLPKDPEPIQLLSPHKAECRRYYNEISQQLDASVFGEFSSFLNLGYVPGATASDSVIKLPENWLNKNSVQLVLEVIGSCDLTGRHVLDVGCGRGGAISVIQQFFKPERVCGIDLAPAAISFCRANHRHPNISFEVGDAEQLPFEDESFDVITNIESSSTYPDIFKFYREAFRVLRPGGYLLYTDALPVQRFNECTEYLQQQGLELKSDRDITTNVLASCDEIAGQRLEVFDRQADRSMQDFLGAPGSYFYDEMKRGGWTYRIQRWAKPLRAVN